VGALTQIPAGDIDVYLRTSTEEAEATLAKLHESVQKNQARLAPKKRLLVTRSRNTVTFYRVSGQSVLLPPVQVRTPGHICARPRAQRFIRRAARPLPR